MIGTWRRGRRRWGWGKRCSGAQLRRAAARVEKRRVAGLSEPKQRRLADLAEQELGPQLQVLKSSHGSIVETTGNSTIFGEYSAFGSHLHGECASLVKWYI